MSSFPLAAIAEDLENRDSELEDIPCDEGLNTVQRMILCDRVVKLGGLHLPALLASIIGGVLLGWLLTFILDSIFTTLGSLGHILLGLIRIAAILFFSYAIQKFLRVRNMFPGLWPEGLRPDALSDPGAAAVRKVIDKLCGIKNAAKKLGGLGKLVDSVGGLKALVCASGGLAPIINEYGTFEKFVCELGGVEKLQAELPGSELYEAMGARNPNDIEIPLGRDLY